MGRGELAAQLAAPVERGWDADGVRIHGAVWERPGAGAPPLVLLHGIWDTWRTFAGVAPRLARGRAVYAPDLRGHGDSDKPEWGYRHADYAADVLAVLRHLPHGRVDLLGFSLGALVALHLAAEHPERLARLVLEDPPLDPAADPRGRAAWFAALLELKRLPFAEVVDELAALNPGRDRATNEASARALINTADGPFRAHLDREDGEDAGTDVPALLARLAASGPPTLVLRADPASGGALADAGRDQLLAALPAARLVEFPGAGHLLHAERPDEFVAAVEGFLTG